MKLTFQFGGCQMTVDADALSQADRVGLARALMAKTTPAERAETLILADQNGLDNYLQAAGETFESHCEKAGLFGEWSQPAPTMTREISTETVEKAATLDDKDLARLLDSYGMFNQKVV